jgi:bifunctional DNase/RNase
LVPVRVLGLAVDSRMQPVVLLAPLLADEDGPRMMVPIWVGSQEAASISIAVSGDEPPRPLSHDLMQRLLAVVGATVERVEVTRIEEGTYYAELSLSTPTGHVTLDCRPSDAIALASRVGAPLFVAEAVLAEAGVPEDSAEEAEDDGTEEPQSPAEAEQSVAEFRRFLDDVDPEDFQG